MRLIQANSMSQTCMGLVILVIQEDGDSFCATNADYSLASRLHCIIFIQIKHNILDGTVNLCEVLSQFDTLIKQFGIADCQSRLG